MIPNEDSYRRTDTIGLQNATLPSSINSPPRMPETCLGSLAVSSDLRQHGSSLGRRKRQHSTSRMISEDDIASMQNKIDTDVFPDANHARDQAAIETAITDEEDLDPDAELIDDPSKSYTAFKRHKVTAETCPPSQCVSAAWDVETYDDRDTESMDDVSINAITSKHLKHATETVTTADQRESQTVSSSLPHQTDHGRDAKIALGVSENNTTSKQLCKLATKTSLSHNAKQAASEATPANSLPYETDHVSDAESRNGLAQNLGDVGQGQSVTKRTAWNERFAEIEYNHILGQCDDPSSTMAPSHWTHKQHQREEPCLNPDRPNNCNEFGGSDRNSLKWSHGFDELVRYKEQHGNSLVPGTYRENPELGRWVCAQRTDYNKLQGGQQSALTQERKDKLEFIGFQRQVCSDSWSQRFGELVQYIELYGNCLVPAKCKENPVLGNWVSRQRKEYKKLKDGRHSALTQERKDKLEAVGFQWQVCSDSWSQRFDELVQYIELHGNCLVPAKCKENPVLGNWVSRQRKEYKKLQDGRHSALTQERKDKLEAIGFQWQVKCAPGWSQRFDELVHYREIHGNCLIPTRYKENPGLGLWVHTQRKEYKKVQDGEHSALTQEHKEKLAAIGFQWQILAMPGWSQRFDELVQYKAIHGNCLVPQDYEEYPELGRWVNTQRREHKKLRDGKPSALTQERKDKLEAIGFQWQVKRATGWSQRFDELVHYREIHGNCLIPARYKENPGLGLWVASQRSAYKSFQEGVPSGFTQERKDKLEGIGFQWRVRGPSV